MNVPVIRMTSAANERSSAGLHVGMLGAGVPPPDGFCGGIHTLKPQSSFRDLPVIAALASQQNGLGAAKGVEIDLAGKGDENSLVSPAMGNPAK